MTTKLDDQIQALVTPDKAPPVPTIEKIEEETKRDEAALEKEKKHTVHQAWKWVLVTAVICCIVVLAALTLNYVLPETWCWIVGEKRHILTTSFLSTLVGYMIKSVQKYV